MNEDHLKALSAFVDGESTDSEVLLEALSQPGCVGVLSDFVRLRLEFEADSSKPSDAFYRRALRTVRARPKPRISRVLATAAAVGWICVGLLLWSDRSIPVSNARSLDTAEPPTPSRSLAFVPGQDWKGRDWQAGAPGAVEGGDR